MADSMERSRPWDSRKDPIDPLELRRRRILDALFRVFASRRWDATAVSHAGFDVEILGSTHALSCSEPVIKKRVPLTKGELRARSQWDSRDYKIVEEQSGVLRIRTNRSGGRSRDFIDSADATLESRLNAVIISLLEHSITVEERDRRAEVARQEEIEAQRRYREAEIARWNEQERLRKEVARRDELLQESQLWRKAVDLRSYIKASVAAGLGDEEWERWASRVADALDPLTEAEE